jgi:hypothetical protein
MKVRIKLFPERLKLYDTEPLEARIHDMLSHAHSLFDFYKTLLKFLKILDVVEFDLLSEVVPHLQVVSHIEQVLSEFANRELSGRVNLLLVSLDGVVVLGQLIDQLFFVLLDLFFENFDFLILLGNQLLDFVDVGLGQGLGCALILA